MTTVDFFTAFAGRHKAYGLVVDALGRITKQYTGNLVAEIQGDHCALNEEFTFSDGPVYQRQWSIRRLDATRYAATAGDVIGAARATVTGNLARWDYPQRLALGKNGFVIGVTDLMVFMPDGVTLGYTKLRKFGLPVGKLITVFQRQPPTG